MGSEADPIDYPRFVQEALRHVVRRAIDVVAAEGLPGAHCFYLAFRTDHPGVELSTALRSRFPEEMTIVLQHQFWDLRTDERGFGVGLSFGRVPEQLFVPWGALIGFSDPSVPFGVSFEPVPAQPEDEPEADEPEADEPAKETGNVVSMDRFRKR